MIKAFHDFMLDKSGDTCQVIDYSLIHLLGKSPKTKRSLRVKSRGRKIKTKGKTTLKMGSTNIRNQDGPNCYSHAVSTALRGIISWRKKKEEAKERPNIAKRFEKLPEHIDLQQTINSIYAAGSENALVNVPILEENFSRMGIVKKRYHNIWGVIKDLLNHDNNGIHITISIFADNRDYESLMNITSDNNIVYYPEGDILPSFKLIKKNKRQAGYILPPKTGHRMFVSGIGVDFKGNYFLEIKNSWGSQWGDGGKIKLSIDYFKEISEIIGSFNLGSNVSSVVDATSIPSLRRATFRFEGYVPSRDYRNAAEKMGLDHEILPSPHNDNMGGRRKSRRKKRKRTRKRKRKRIRKRIRKRKRTRKKT